MKQKDILLTAATILVIASCYLYLLNNRYMKIGGFFIYDKWTGKYLVSENAKKPLSKWVTQDEMGKIIPGK